MVVGREIKPICGKSSKTWNDGVVSCGRPGRYIGWEHPREQTAEEDRERGAAGVGPVETTKKKQKKRAAEGGAGLRRWKTTWTYIHIPVASM